MSDATRCLLLIRHAAVQVEPAFPPDRWHLSAAGRASCQLLAAQIERYQPACFVTSREPKAQETGQIIADCLNLPWHTAENLHEHDRRGMPYFEDKQAFEAAVIQLLTGPEDELLLGQETAGQARRRFDRAIREVLGQRPVENIAIVSHGTVITLFLRAYNPALSPVSFWRSLKLPDYLVVSLPDFTLET